jgi:transposase
MERRKFTREFKLETVKLIKERGVGYAQASRDLGVHQTVLRDRVKSFGSDPAQAFRGHGRQSPEQAEITRLKREVARLKAERDIQKKPRPTSRRRAGAYWSFSLNVPTKIRRPKHADEHTRAQMLDVIGCSRMPTHTRELRRTCIGGPARTRTWDLTVMSGQL